MKDYTLFLLIIPPKRASRTLSEVFQINEQNKQTLDKLSSLTVFFYSELYSFLTTSNYIEYQVYEDFNIILLSILYSILFIWIQVKLSCLRIYYSKGKIRHYSDI